MYFVGIDIGSSAAKVIVMEEGKVVKHFLLNTGFSSRKTADDIYEQLEAEGINKDNATYVATGYGRISVPYADRVVTEITCHGKGAYYLFHDDGTVIDIGGQDTKGISLKNGRVMKFLMNDKCSAGTGKFIEVMTNRLGLTQNELSDLARKGEHITIRSDDQFYVYCICGIRSNQSDWSWYAKRRYCVWCHRIGCYEGCTADCPSAK